MATKEVDVSEFGPQLAPYGWTSTDLPERPADYQPESAWATWRQAGADYAKECRAGAVSVVPLADKSLAYGRSRGLPHPEVIARAFREGYQSADVKAPSVDAVAKEFSRIMREWLTADELAEVDRRNRAESNPCICHSHDLCDPNQAMIDAFTAVGVEYDVQNDAHGDCSNRAWQVVKANGFAKS